MPTTFRCKQSLEIANCWLVFGNTAFFTVFSFSFWSTCNQQMESTVLYAMKPWLCMGFFWRLKLLSQVPYSSEICDMCRFCWNIKGFRQTFLYVAIGFLSSITFEQKESATSRLSQGRGRLLTPTTSAAPCLREKGFSDLLFPTDRKLAFDVFGWNLALLDNRTGLLSFPIKMANKKLQVFFSAIFVSQ